MKCEKIECLVQCSILHAQYLPLLDQAHPGATGYGCEAGDEKEACLQRPHCRHLLRPFLVAGDAHAQSTSKVSV